VNRFGHIFAVLTLAAALGGCVLPTAMYQTYAVANSASVASTGKTATGHGVSLITDEDCDPARSLEGDPVCRPAGMPDSDANPSDTMDEPSRSQTGAAFADLTHGNVRAMALDLPEYTVPEAPEPFAVVATFPDPEDARMVALELNDLPAVTAPANLGGRQYHRVLVGPLTPRIEAVLPGRLANAGITSHYTLRLCARDYTHPPCISEPQYRPRIDPAELTASNDAVPHYQTQK
jgi:hypothetical protein